MRYEKEKDRYIFTCGGTLVTAKTVITAAHCIQNKGSPVEVKSSELRVILGAHNLNDATEPEKKSVRVVEIKMHKTWNAPDMSSYQGDIALLVLGDAVKFTDYIRPICLSSNLPTITDGIVAGWGRQENQKLGTSNKIPRKIDIPIVEDKICYEKFVSLSKGGWNKSFCAGRKNVSVCDGDSGSGFYVKLNGRFYLKGIVSNSALHDQCVDGYYAIYADAVKYHPFITSHHYQLSAEINQHNSTIQIRNPDDNFRFPNETPVKEGKPENSADDSAPNSVKNNEGFWFPIALAFILLFVIVIGYLHWHKSQYTSANESIGNSSSQPVTLQLPQSAQPLQPLQHPPLPPYVKYMMPTAETCIQAPVTIINTPKKSDHMGWAI